MKSSVLLTVIDVVTRKQAFDTSELYWLSCSPASFLALHNMGSLIARPIVARLRRRRVACAPESSATSIGM